MAKIREKEEIVVVSKGLNEKKLTKMKLRTSEFIQAALNKKLKEEPRAKLAVLLYAPLTLPLF